MAKRYLYLISTYGKGIKFSFNKHLRETSYVKIRKTQSIVFVEQRGAEIPILENCDFSPDSPEASVLAQGVQE